MTENERKAHAEYLMKDMGREIEFLSIVETVPEDATEEDLHAIDELIRNAHVEVTWND